jgi:hypothetical protein
MRMTNDPFSLLWLLWVIISNYKQLQSYEHYAWPMLTPLLPVMDHTSHSKRLKFNTHTPWPVNHVHSFWQLMGLNKPQLAFTIHFAWPMTHVHPLWHLGVISRNYMPIESYEHYPWPMFTRCYHSLIKQAILSHYNPILIPHDPWTMFTRSNNS